MVCVKVRILVVCVFARRKCCVVWLGLLLSSNVGERGGSDKGRERPLGAVDLTVTDGGLFEGRGSNLGEVLKILEDIVAKGVDIADLDDVIEREVQKME